MNANSELNLQSRAIKDRWPLTQEQREKLIVRTYDLAMSEDYKVAARAISVLAQLDALNLKKMEIDIKAAPTLHLHTNLDSDEIQMRIKQKAAALGLEFDGMNLLDGGNPCLPK